MERISRRKVSSLALPSLVIASSGCVFLQGGSGVDLEITNASDRPVEGTVEVVSKDGGETAYSRDFSLNTDEDYRERNVVEYDSGVHLVSVESGSMITSEELNTDENRGIRSLAIIVKDISIEFERGVE